MPRQPDLLTLPEFAPRAVPGVSVGYELHPGAKRGGDYLVAELTSLETLGFRTARVGDNVVHAHRTNEVIVVMKDKLRFPLRAKYDQSFLE